MENFVHKEISLDYKSKGLIKHAKKKKLIISSNFYFLGG